MTDERHQERVLFVQFAYFHGKIQYAFTAGTTNSLLHYDAQSNMIFEVTQ